MRILLILGLFSLVFGCSMKQGYTVGWHGVKYAKKDFNGIYLSRAVAGADKASFVILNENYARDANNCYYRGDVIAEADPATFAVMGSGDLYSKDAQRVFIANKKLSDDAPNFRHTGGGYSVDSTTVYFLDQVVEGAVVDTWQSKGNTGPFGTDGEKVYHEGKPLPGADPAHLETLNYSYSKDKEHVYFKNELVEGADPETFVFTDSDEGKDKNGTYKRSARKKENTPG